MDLITHLRVLDKQNALDKVKLEEGMVVLSI